MREQTIVASVLLHDRRRAEAAICKDRFGCPPLHLAFTVSVSKDRSISTDSRNGLRREGCPSVREGHDVPVLFFLLTAERTLALTTRNCFRVCRDSPSANPFTRMSTGSSLRRLTIGDRSNGCGIACRVYGRNDVKLLAGVCESLLQVSLSHHCLSMQVSLSHHSLSKQFVLVQTSPG